jgi:hypothetical protein
VPAPPPRAHDDGCTDDHPHRLANQGNVANLIITCANDDGSSLVVKNTTSALVLVVRPADANNIPYLAVSPSDSPSFKEEAVNDSVPLKCSGLPQTCLLTPNSTLTADASAGVVRLTADVDKVATATATVANSAAGYAQSKLTLPTEKLLRSISDCASAAGSAAAAHQFDADAVRDSMAQVASCGGLMDEIAREANEPAPEETEAGKRVLRYAGDYSADLRRDFKVYAAIEVLSRLRR